MKRIIIGLVGLLASATANAGALEKDASRVNSSEVSTMAAQVAIDMADIFFAGKRTAAACANIRLQIELNCAGITQNEVARIKCFEAAARAEQNCLNEINSSQSMTIGDTN